MRAVKVLIGIVLLLAGLAGIGYSLLIMTAAGAGANALKKQSKEILSSAQEGVEFLQTGTKEVNFLLTDTKTRVEELDTTLAGLEQSTKNKPLLDSLDENIAYKLQRAQASVASLQTTVEGLNNTLTLFHSLPGITPEDEKSKKNTTNARELSKVLMEASEVLRQIHTFLDEILTKPEVSKQSLKKVRELVAEIDGKITEAKSQVDEFDQRLTVTNNRVVETQKKIKNGIDSGYVMLLIFFICFAFSQVSLLLHALQMFRKPAA